jgi:integral membrane sensor domain MASE1
MKLKPRPLIGLNLFLAIVYFAAAELGLSLASLHSNVTPVWPPAGIAIASLLIFGPQLWPGIFLGALAANWLTSIPFASAFGIAFGNTLQALVAYWLLLRVVRWRRSFSSVGEVMSFVVCAGVVAPLVSATIGSLSLCLGGAAEWNRFTSMWLTWWMGDGFGAVIVG